MLFWNFSSLSDPDLCLHPLRRLCFPKFSSPTALWLFKGSYHTKAARVKLNYFSYWLFSVPTRYGWDGCFKEKKISVPSHLRITEWSEFIFHITFYTHRGFPIHCFSLLVWACSSVLLRPDKLDSIIISFSNAHDCTHIFSDTLFLNLLT